MSDKLRFAFMLAFMLSVNSMAFAQGRAALGSTAEPQSRLSSAGIGWYWTQPAKLDQQCKECPQGCDECLPTVMGLGNLYDPCGTDAASRDSCGTSQYDWCIFTECEHCNDVCPGLIPVIQGFRHFMLVDPSTVDPKIAYCEQFPESTYCVTTAGASITGGWGKSWGIEVGFAPGSETEDFSLLYADQIFWDKVDDFDPLDQLYGFREAAWRHRKTALALIVADLGGPASPVAVTGPAGPGTLHYYLQAWYVTEWFYWFDFGWIFSKMPTDIGFPFDDPRDYSQPLTDQIIDIKDATCDYIDWLDCGAIGVEAASWGRIKSQYR